MCYIRSLHPEPKIPNLTSCKLASTRLRLHSTPTPASLMENLTNQIVVNRDIATMVPLVLLLFATSTFSEPLLRTCEPIRVEICDGLGYNMTSMPNLGGHDLQQEAEYVLKSFAPLISYGCSSQLKLFLCSVYVPMCTEKVSNPIGPCRGLCEGVKSRCYPVLSGFGFTWPEALNCSRFPVENNHEHMCMEGPKDKEVDITAPVNPAVQKFGCGRNEGVDEMGRCVPVVCGAGLMFDEGEKKFAEVWVTVWAMICFVTSLASALTLSIGGGRVKARPLISLALCYCMVSAGWALRMFSGRASPYCPGSGHAEDSLSNVNCAFIFLLIYYFGMAANAWWVCLCAWWVARVGLSWPPEKLRGLGSALHVCAWGLPAAQTVAALVRRDVDSDELTGTCYIGNRNSTALLFLVLLPQFLYFLFGVVLLVLGCVFVVRKPPAPAAAPLTAPAPRKENDFLGAICTLYAVPTFCVLASLYYEYANRQEWLERESKPPVWTFLVRHLMGLFIGVSSIFWIWSMKSVMVWRAMLRRIGPRKQVAVKMQPMPVLRYVPPHPSVASMSTTSRHSTRSHSHRKPRVHHVRTGSETVI